MGPLIDTRLVGRALDLNFSFGANKTTYRLRITHFLSLLNSQCCIVINHKIAIVLGIMLIIVCLDNIIMMGNF